MSKHWVRHHIQQYYKLGLRYALREVEPEELNRTAIIFSPHPDDEILGCGGTIMKKRNVGADVKVVYMTDGRRSHAHLMPEDDLVAQRAKEARKACQMLGVDEENIISLGFHDRKLRENFEAAIRLVKEILLRQQPEEIFIPYYRETPSDHLATNNIVLSALQKYGRRVIIFEYPLWFWHTWPWARVTIGSRREILSVWKNSVISSIKLFKDLRYFVEIGDVVEHKRAALNMYQSQMTRLVPDSRWMTLADISDGEWLKCFFQPYELFYRYEIYENT